MKFQEVKLVEVRDLTPDTKSFLLEKPAGFKFTSAQAITIYLKGAETKRRTYTIASTDKDKFIELIIKKYAGGFSEILHNLKAGDSIVISEAFGRFKYVSPGVFIAGGVGVTPYLAIFRSLDKKEASKNILIYSCRTYSDIINEKELKELLGENLIITLSREEKEGYATGRINEEMLKKYIKDFNQKFYICGTREFIDSMKGELDKLGVKPESIEF